MSDSTVDRLLLRDRWIVGGCVALITVLAWVWLWREAKAMAPDESMPGMEMPGAAMVSPTDAAAYLRSTFVMWFLMMVAMMLPSAAPMILFYSGLARGARAKGPSSRRHRFSPPCIWLSGPDSRRWRRWPNGSRVAGRGVRNDPRVRQSAHWRLSSDRRRPLSGDAAEASLPRHLPFTDVVSDAILAAGLGRRCAAWPLPRNGLSGLLRGAHGASVCVRRDEPRLGRGAGAGRSGRKGLSDRTANRRGSRRRLGESSGSSWFSAFGRRPEWRIDEPRAARR